MYPYLAKQKAKTKKDITNHIGYTINHNGFIGYIFFLMKQFTCAWDQSFSMFFMPIEYLQLVQYSSFVNFRFSLVYGDIGVKRVGGVGFVILNFLNGHSRPVVVTYYRVLT